MSKLTACFKTKKLATAFYDEHKDSGTVTLNGTKVNIDTKISLSKAAKIKMMIIVECAGGKLSK